MDDWNRNQHGKSGLWQRVLESRRSTSATAEAQTVEFLAQWVPAGQVADVRQLDLPGPAFPVSADAAAGTLFPLPQPRRVDDQGARAALGAGSRAGFSKESAHTALSDVRDSIAELRYYRPFMGRLAGNSTSR